MIPCRTEITVTRDDIVEYAGKNPTEFSEIALDAFVDSGAVDLVLQGVARRPCSGRASIAAKMLDEIEKYIMDFYRDDPDIIEMIEDRFRDEDVA